MTTVRPYFYQPNLFINRENEINTALAGIESFHIDRSRDRALIFTGVRRVGKTWFSLHLARTLIPASALGTFFVSLLPVAEGGKPGAGEWWPETELPRSEPDQSSDGQGLEILTGLLDKISQHWQTTPIKTGDLDDKSKYLQRDVSELPADQTLVLIIDSAYESPPGLFGLFQRYILTPLTHTSRVFTIITGRGTPPLWSSPYLRTAPTIKMVPFRPNQIARLLADPRLPQRPAEGETIAEISGGYPGTARLIAESAHEDPYDAIPGVLEELLADVPHVDWKIVRLYLDRICVFTRPFKESEVDALLQQMNDQEISLEDARLANDRLIEIHLLEWHSGGYELNESIRIPLEKYLKRKAADTWDFYRNAAVDLFTQLETKLTAEGYAEAASYYSSYAQELAQC